MHGHVLVRCLRLLLPDELSGRPIAPNVTERGSTGQGCAAGTVPWNNFWPNQTYPTVAIQFEEWPAASTYANRDGLMPGSLN